MIGKITKITASALVASLLLAFSAYTAGASDISAVRTYNGQFTDVSSSDWYYDSVAGAYSLGLVSGVEDNRYSPNGTITIAQAVKIAVSCHQLLSVGKTSEVSGDKNWYDGYVSYAVKNGIVTEEYENYSAAASRAQVAVLLSRAVVSSGSEPEELNKISFGELSDVPTDAWYAGAIYRLYRWGIMTGSGGKLNPEGEVKRSEIAAVALRVADSSKRVDVNGNSSGANTTITAPTTTNTTVNPSTTSLELYTGQVKEQKFAGITSFAVQFREKSGAWFADASYSLELVNNIVLESDNISFRLYQGSGYEALGIVRGWLNGCATGQDGEKIASPSDGYSELNDLFYLFIDEERVTIEQLWYADHGDYTTYAFYFDKAVNFDNAVVIDILCGKNDSETLSLCGLSGLSSMVENAEKGLEFGGAKADSSSGSTGSDTTNDSDSYKTAISDAKQGADIIFEERNSRCTVLYGSGLYNSGANDYRLVFIYPNGTTQNVSNQRLSSIRMSEDVLYYSMTAPDGQKLQYGVNFSD